MMMGQQLTKFLKTKRYLTTKQPTRCGPSHSGISFCGFRISPGRLLLSKRRKARYTQTRTKWERAYTEGWLDKGGLQAGYASALAQTLAADACSWRRAQLKQKPLVRELLDV